MSIFCWELLTRDIAWKDKTEQEVKDALLAGSRLEVPYFCPKGYKLEVLDALWAADPAARPSFTTLVESFKIFSTGADFWEEQTAIEMKIILKHKSIDEKSRQEKGTNENETTSIQSSPQLERLSKHHAPTLNMPSPKDKERLFAQLSNVPKKVSELISYPALFAYFRAHLHMAKGETLVRQLELYRDILAWKSSHFTNRADWEVSLRLCCAHCC